MRLIGSVENEKQAFTFYSFLLQLGIHSTYEPFTNQETKKEEILIWIYEEDAVDQAVEWLKEFKSNPQDPKFANIPLPFVPPQPPDHIAERHHQEEKKAAPLPPLRSAKRAAHSAISTYPLAVFIVMLCVFLFTIDTTEEVQLVQKVGPLGLVLGRTSLQKEMLFDYTLPQQKVDELIRENPLPSIEEISKMPPELLSKLKEIEEMPNWSGVVDLIVKKIKGKSIESALAAPLFYKIRQGEVWRLFTPALMHGGFLHILFNMLWTWILLKQMEGRLGRFKILLLILLMGVIANVAQYLMSGPLFLGFSGVIVGLVGFIWMRQKIAPWEGYPLQRPVIFFVLIFVLAMLAIDLVILALTLTGVTDSPFQIGNTAHVAGGISGILLARIPFFSRGMI